MGLSFVPMASASTAPKYETTFVYHCDNNAYACPGYSFYNEGKAEWGGDGSQAITTAEVHYVIGGVSYTYSFTWTGTWTTAAQPYGFTSFVYLAGTSCMRGPDPPWQGCLYIPGPPGDSGTPVTPGHYDTAFFENYFDYNYGLPPGTPLGPGLLNIATVTLVQ